MRLVPGVCSGLSDQVHESHTVKPLLVGKLDLADEVVQMCNERAHDEACPVRHIGTNGVDDSSCEVGIKAVLCISFLVLRRLLCVWVHDDCGVLK
jgi:hypothetical protein